MPPWQRESRLTEIPDLRRYPALDGKTLLICVGAMKCATSWIHHYLGGLPEVAVSPLKELHFFSRKFPTNALGDSDALAIRRLAHHAGREGDPTANLRASATFRASVDRVQMIYDDDAYFAHFARLAGPETRALCDITPAYAVIGAEGFSYIKAFCASQDIALKLLYVMRDPVDRLWSQLRHIQQLDARREARTDWPDWTRNPRVLKRADYRATVQDLDAVFAPQDLLYLFYEDLFAEPALRALCDHVGAAYRPGAPEERHNRTAVDCALPDDARAAFRALLAPQYAFCRDRFGGRVPVTWAA